jgi:hypothetical protein
VLGGDGEVLDLGRTLRLFTGAARRALLLRDGGCAFPGCDRPAQWCDVALRYRNEREYRQAIREGLLDDPWGGDRPA